MTAHEDLLLLLKFVFFRLAAQNTPTDQQLMYAIQAWKKEAFDWAGHESEGELDE